MAQGERAVLVGRGLDRNRAIRQLDQPGPAAAEDAKGRSGQLVLKGRERTELCVDGLGQFAGGGGAAFAQRRPPEGVVGVASALIADGGAGGFGPGIQICDQILDGLSGQLGMSGDGGVEIIHVGLMVLVVMQVHGGRVEVRLQRVIGVGQRRQGKSSGRGCRRGCRCGLAGGESPGVHGFGQQQRAGRAAQMLDCASPVHHGLKSPLHGSMRESRERLRGICKGGQRPGLS